MFKKQEISKKEKHIFVIFILALSIFAYLVYQPFISNKYIYGLAGDATQQMIPEIQGILNVVLKGEFPMFSFNKGLGQQITVGNPMWLGDLFTILPLFFFQDNFIYFMGCIALLKIILSGVIFYFYLKELGIAPYSRAIIAMIYAFNGHMICRGAWIHYATEVVFVALWLFSLERFFCGKKKIFPLVLAILFFSRTASYIFIYSLFTFFYIVMRTVFKEGVQVKKILQNILFLIPYYLIGLGISAVLVLPGILNILHSSRLGQAPNLFIFGDIKLIMAAYAKMFSHSILGYDVPSNYLNILEDPTIYAGIISILFIPQILVFKNIKKREKNVLLICLSLIAIYYIFPGTIYFYNAFSSRSIKISSFWQIVILLLVAGYVFNKLETKQEKVNKFLFVGTVFCYIVGLLIIYYVGDNFILQFSLYFPISIIALYSIVILFPICKNRKREIIIAVCILEVIGNAHDLISANAILLNDRVKNYQSMFESTVYNEAISMIDDDNFYRISSNLGMGENFSQYYGYNGVGSYVSVQPAQQKELYDFFNINHPDINIFPDFTLSNTTLASLLGVKYFMYDTTKGGSIPKGFVPHLSHENIDIYMNKNVVPFGVVFYEYLSPQQWSTFNELEKESLMMDSLVLDSVPYSHQSLEKTIFKQTSDIDIQIGDTNNLMPKDLLTAKKMKYTSLSNDPMIYMSLKKDNMENLDMYQISFTATSSIKTKGQIFYWQNGAGASEENSKVFDVVKGTKDYNVVLIGDIDQIRLDVGSDIGEFNIEDFKIVAYENTIDQSIDQLKASAMQVDKFSNNKIVGNITLDNPGFVFFPILDVDGWSIYANGVKQEILRADGGLMACALPAGEYRIELNYVTPGLMAGAAISFISTIIYIMILFYKKHKKSSDSNCG